MDHAARVPRRIADADVVPRIAQKARERVRHPMRVARQVQ